MLVLNVVLNNLFAFAAGIAGVILIVFLTIELVENRKLKNVILENEVLNNIIKVIEPGKSYEKKLMDLLAVFTSVIEAQSYAIFFLDSKNSGFTLKAVRHMVDENEQIGPAYSGLLPYKKETFLMPSYIPEDLWMDSVEIIKEGEVSLVFMPIIGKKAIILMGPADKLPKKKIKLLEALSRRLNTFIDAIGETEDLKKELKLVVSSGRAVKNVSNFFTDFSDMLDTILKVSIRSVNASGGMFIGEDNGKQRVETIVGLDEETGKMLREDKETLSLLKRILAGRDFAFVNKRDKEFFSIPPYFIVSEIESILLLNVYGEYGNGIAAIWYGEGTQIKDYQIAALKIMTKRMGDIINNHMRFKQLSHSYVDILKMLARLLDNLSPYTISYSELMYRYSVAIAMELKLPQEEIKDIGLAAYLSNIGIIGLSDDILHKKGKFSEIEYEMMKLHADAGASIIEATIGNHKVASFIRYHHERMDGYGYPEGFKGEEIPVGARIIAVVQTFLAKIMGREYRTALPFEKALEQLKTASGSQLDPKAVNALLEWFERRERACSNIKRSLGGCWEMRCAPENICAVCPAYKNTGKNCWEFGKNNCNLHGNKCKSCFIYSEFLYRMKSNYGQNRIS